MRDMDWEFLHYYEARVVDVYDGDTVTLNIRLGFYHEFVEQRFRLASIQAPELREPTLKQAPMSRDYLRSMVLGKRVMVKTVKNRRGRDKKGSFGRWLATLYLWDEETKAMLDVNRIMMQEGHAVPY